MSRFMDKDC